MMSASPEVLAAVRALFEALDKQGLENVLQDKTVFNQYVFENPKLGLRIDVRPTKENGNG